MKGFKAFLLRGNVVDLAVAVVIGAAFTAVVSTFAVGFITPLIALLFGQRSFGGFSFTVNGVLFSFGPFIGFWSAYDAASRRGCLVVPGGGMNTLARLELLATTAATAVFSTPSYALHMAEVASQHGIDLGGLSVRRLILAGEPGGSVGGQCHGNLAGTGSQNFCTKALRML